MPLMDEFREERQEMRNRPFRERLSYFWDYYKWHVLGGIAAGIFLGSLIHTMVTAKDSALYVAAINYFEQDGAESAVSEPFLEQLGIDPQKYEIFVDTSFRESDTGWTQEDVASQQKLAVMIAASDVDLLAAGQGNFLKYAYQDFLSPLGDYYTEPELAAIETSAEALGLEPFFYIDRAVVRAVDEAGERGATYDLASVPDPARPDLMDDPVAVGIRTDLFPRFTGSYLFLEEDTAAFLGRFQNSEAPETAKAFLDFLRR